MLGFRPTCVAKKIAVSTKCQTLLGPTTVANMENNLKLALTSKTIWGNEAITWPICEWAGACFVPCY